MIRLRQVKLSIYEEDKLVTKIESILKTKVESYTIIKKSLDARKKPDLYYIYEVDVLVSNEQKVLKRFSKNDDIFLAPIEKYERPNSGDVKLSYRPIIIGSGPAGLFATYLLSEAGYRPLLFERGESVEIRKEKIEKFWQTGQLDEQTNVQFGEGGAGTFSDGKLNTMVKDKACRGKKVFETFVSCGAPANILYEAHPHIGTDLLQKVIKNMREKIKEMGGEIRYSACLTNVHIKNNQIKEIAINDNETYPCDCLILALGHSARDTFKMLYEKGLLLESKPFAVGLRIEHPQKMIDESQYGKDYPKFLPPASYKLTYQTKEKRGVYSFCMCPGGYVVNASSIKNHLVINGMSEHKRDSLNANAALLVTVSEKDYGPGVFAGMNFQEKLEKKAYNLKAGNIPMQTLKDFLRDEESTTLGEVKSITQGAYEMANLNTILPSFIKDSLKEAIPYFGSKIKGYDREDALLFGIESRSSSPIRMKRNENLESNISCIYVCGEGAGYAGGITTSAMDGLKCAEEIIKKFAK